MALFDKFNTTNTEINRINGQIKSEEGKISGFQYTLGTLLLKKLDEGAAFDDDIMQEYAKIKNSRESISAMNNQIDVIKKEAEEAERARQAEIARRAEEAAAQKAAKAAAAAAAASAQSQVTAGGLTCPGCGKAVSSNMKFCNGCGAKLEFPAPAPAPTPTAASIKFCPGCGKEIKPGMKFCIGCGRKLD